MTLRRASARTAGLLLSAGILVVFAGVVTFFVIRNPQAGPVAAPPPDVTPDPSLVPTKGGTQPQAVSRFGGGEGFRLQIVDKDDPSIVRAELSAARSTPIEGQTYRVALEKPVIWMFLKDGRTVHARADKGTAYLPDQGASGAPGRPQDGVMEGDVVARVFEARADGSRPSPEADKALLEARTGTVKFDAELGSVEAPGRVEVRHTVADFTGSGIVVLYNDARARLELLSIARAERLEVRPKAAERDEQVARAAPRPAGARPGAGGAPRASGNGASTTPTQAVESLYHLISEGPGNRVTLTQGERTIAAETMELWARLVDNELRPGAIMSSNVPRAGTGGTKAAGGITTPRPAPSQPGATPAPASAAFTPDSDEPVVITWTGPLKIVPVESATELTYNDVLARFTSASDHGVTITDADGKTTGSGSLLEYGATRRDVVLAGRAGARLESKTSGLAEAARFEMSLVTGVARVPGAGTLRSEDRSLAWNNQAEFHFRLDERREVTQAVTKVIADGTVRATDGDASLSGGALHATLIPVGVEDSRLQTLSIIGKARAQDAGGGFLAADTLDVAFVPAPGADATDADPSKVLARGAVRAERDGSVLEAAELDAVIGRAGEKQELTATKIDAKEVVFTDDTGTRAEAARMTADPVARTARLEGPAGTVRVSREGATIEGQDMTFRDTERRLAVAGPGKLTHNSQAKGSEPVTAVVATWTESMAFDDLAGTATCVGGAEAVMTKAQGGAITQRDRMNAERVDLWITPAARTDSSEQDRTLLRAELAGGPSPAKVESRRYATPTQGQEAAVEQVHYLESARIELDDVKGTLVTPGAGKFFVMDRRAGAEARPDRGPMELGGGPGTSLFAWNGSMALDRAKGVVTLREGVTLTHQRAGDKVVSELDCGVLTANIRVHDSGADGADPARGMTGELISADAQDGVVMAANGRTLVADQATYDAMRRVITAHARGSNVVQLHDATGTEPQTARELRWDMANDRIDIIQPGTTTGPRR